MKKALTFDEKYQVILDKDPGYEGIFITAVKTTGIFCRPTCSARKPLSKNVVFYDTIHEAILNGFRPCKVCKPMLPADQTPEYIQEIIKELSDNPFARLKDYDLVKRGIEPSKIRRWFKKHHNLTFHGYQRMLRINHAYTQITQGAKVSSAAFDAGFESLSGFNASYQSIFGKPPTTPEKKTVIHIVRFATPLGPMYACATQQGLCLLEFTNRRMLETEFKDLTRRLKAVILPGPNPHLDQVQKEMGEYFAGTRSQFSVPLHTPGTDFQNSVWEKLITIPYGQTTYYQALAEQLDRPNSARAVASANGFNRISIIVPCHRVIGKDGNLTGYGGGLDRKQWLLDFEAKHQSS